MGNLKFKSFNRFGKLLIFTVFGNMENATPMVRQYLEIKKQYPGTILFFRLGDFYEMFNEDAIVGARELEITLTARQKDSPNPVPMCGVPHHAAANYIAKLVRKGYRVAICEQTETPTKGTKLVKREVVRVITPGTAIDDQLVESKEPVYLAAVCSDGDAYGAAFLDVSTGLFYATERAGRDALKTIIDDVESFAPREILLSEKETSIANALNEGRNSEGPLFTDDTAKNSAGRSFAVTRTDSAGLELRDATEILLTNLGVTELSGFGIEGKNAAIHAAGACLKYAIETQKAGVGHVNEINFLDSANFMILDAVTLRNLELVELGGERSKRTVLGVIDETVTGMGARLLKTWLLRPSIKRSEIRTRQSAVEELTDSILREKTRYLLKEIIDLERLAGKFNYRNVTPRDLVALVRSLSKTPAINENLSDAKSLLIQVLSENIFELPELRRLIESAVNDEPGINVGDGSVIRPGFNAELDEIREAAGNAKRVIASFEASERERTGIGNLKVRFNNVFGYYIEISKANAAKAPENYERRQTLANAERFTTPELKEWEAKVLGAEEKIAKLETKIFEQVLNAVRDETPRLLSTARALATLDALAALAETAAKRNYVCPLLHDGDEVEIKSGRHPVIECFIRDSFVPNDIYLNNSTDRLLIVTGANMGGKSTVLRQVAIIQILAQIGSFVPATTARLPIVDRIWTRVGASDDLSSGRSTFMVEMTETAAILHNATPRSLVLLDEIGRGTSTFDGLSIAWAVAEYLHDSAEHSAKTMFATHYHELTELAENLPGAKNYQITATEEDGEVVFLHKLEKGKASKSYGIAVARLAGLPQAVIERAKDVLARLQKYELAVFESENETGIGAAAGRSAAAQFSLFAMSNENIVNELREMDIQALSEAELREKLSQMKENII